MSFVRKKVVIDSNILVSAAIYPNSARKHLISMHPYRGIPIDSEADIVLLMLKDLAQSVPVKT